MTAAESSGVSELLWQLSEASVRGKAHVDSGIPNQDSVFVLTDPLGEVVCGVVSDGAGTAPRALEGSKWISRAVAQRLREATTRQGDGCFGTDELRLEVATSIRELHAHILEHGGEVSDFHCTLVVWLFAHGRSFVAQVGDSVALTTRFAFVGNPGARQLDFFPEGQHRLHEVQRGEYSNETHFVTEPDWMDHLRTREVEADIDAVILMSDGAMDIAMLRGEVFRGFLSNLLAKLIAMPERADRNGVIHGWLDNPQTYRVTGDDKTVFVAIRQKHRALEDVDMYLAQRAPGAHAITAAMRPEAPVPAEAAPHGMVSLPVPGEEAACAMQAPAAESAPNPRRWIWSGAALLLVAAALLVAAYRPEPPEISLAAAALQLQASVARLETPAPTSRVGLGGDSTFWNGQAKGTVAVLEGAPLTIRRITPDPELTLDERANDACRVQMQLRTDGEACTVSARMRKGARRGEYGVYLEFGSDHIRDTVVKRLVFATAGEAAADPIGR